MTRDAPGKSHCNGITTAQLFDMFPDDEAACVWFEDQVWPEGKRFCPRCGSSRTHECSHAKSPYRCTDCRKYFSVKTGTAMGQSKVPLREWAIAIHLECFSLKGVSSMKLHRDLGVTQSTAWFMLQRMREAWADENSAPFSGLVEADETDVGSSRKNMSDRKRKELAGTGRGGAGKAAVVPSGKARTRHAGTDADGSGWLDWSAGDA